jgi:hypothetical protein
VTIRISNVAGNVGGADVAEISAVLKAEPQEPQQVARHRSFFQATAQAKAPLRSRQTVQKAEMAAEVLLPATQAARMDLAETHVVADVVVAAALALKAAVTAEAADSRPPAELPAAPSKSAASTE